MSVLPAFGFKTYALDVSEDTPPGTRIFFPETVRVHLGNFRCLFYHVKPAPWVYSFDCNFGPFRGGTSVPSLEWPRFAFSCRTRLSIFLHSNLLSEKVSLKIASGVIITKSHGRRQLFYSGRGLTMACTNTGWLYPTGVL